MKILGIILIILGIGGAVTMTLLTYSFTRSYELLEDSNAKMEALSKKPQTKETMLKMEQLQRSITTYQSVIERSNRNIYLSIGGGLVLALIGVILLVKSRKIKTSNDNLTGVKE